MKVKKMVYISIRLNVVVAALLIVSMALLYPSVSGGIQTIANEEVKQEGGDGSCSSSLSDCQQHDDIPYNVDTSGSDNVDENYLQNLFEQAMIATQYQNYNEAISIFDKIYKLARTHYDWNKMKMIHYMHGMTLLQLKRPSDALHYFKSAMMLAEFESTKLDEDMNSSKQELGMFM